MFRLMRLPAGFVDRPERRQWIGIAGFALMLAVAAAALFPGWWKAGADGPSLPQAQAASPLIAGAAPPAPEPLRFREMTPEEAMAINAAVPVAELPNPAAAPFVLAALSEVDRQRAITCLATAIYYEAGMEAADGQRAVAQVVLNRVRHPAFPSTICGVVYQGQERATGCQFTFTCDGALARAPSPSGWARAREVAEAALAGYVHAPVGWATHYHANYVVPYWSASLVKLANVGTHIFYRWTGGWGTAPAFASRHYGVEPEIARIAHLAPPASEGDEATLLADAIDGAVSPAQGEPSASAEEQAGSFASAVLRRAAAAPAAQAPPPASYRSALTRIAPPPAEAVAESAAAAGAAITR